MNQMCKVCGEPAAGFHFGAFTCEGCKSFFGRTYNNLSSIADCKANGECIINKKNRTACKACRLRKCLLVGMSKSGSRYGRRSNWFKIHCLLQEQQHQRKSTTIDSGSGSAASSADGGIGSNGLVGGASVHPGASMPALSFIQQQYQHGFLKTEPMPSICNNGMAALSTATATVGSGAPLYHHHNGHNSNHQQHSPASDSGASSAGDPDETGSHRDDCGSMENFSVDLMPVATIKVEKSSPDPHQAPPLSPPHSRTSNHLYNEFRARYGVFLNEYRNATTAASIRQHNSASYPHRLETTATTMSGVLGIADDQNEPIDLTLSTRKRKESDPSSPAPHLAPSPPVGRLGVGPFELARPTPLDLTLLRSDALSG